ncbi:MAG: AI-2E family transporter [Ignavibacteria bacterium]|nr:AI-2E family transporter [Ignavibacteria bacterium]MBP6509001.1 AI-2E family transporter [Candidatus Kapabacteria bacterium]MBK6420048.1 AI-2E family transporter [Ignavibacteria bacterium]MBK6759320.1 AI-2E family transporter [Ignavibacteria bacterium]MBK7185048.1 AI-2E family transporter [Ignavibacteria bacterium]
MDIVQPWQRLVAISSLLLAIVAGGFILHTLNGILLPFVLAGFLSMVFKPLVHKLRAWRVPFPLVMLTVMLIAAGSLWLIYLIISLGVEQFASTSDYYLQQLKTVTSDIEHSVGSLMRTVGGKGSFKLGSLLTPESATNFATGQVGTLLTIVSDGVMVLLYLLFMLGASEAFPGKIASAFRGERATVVLQLFETLNTRVRTYLVMKTVFNLINAVIAYIILLAFDVDFAPLIALLTFLFHYIPNIGSLFTTILPAFVYLLQTGSVPQALILALILVVIQNIIGNVIEPKVMGDRLELSPVVVLFSLLFWGWMWGIVGMILSIPIMSALKALLETIPSTRPLAILMGSGATPTVVTPPTP